jgi:hypothetical protein
MKYEKGLGLKGLLNILVDIQIVLKAENFSTGWELVD